MKYDDASWHWDSAKKSDNEDETWARACGHIVVYIKWCDANGLYVPEDEESKIELSKARNGESTYTKYFMNWSDGKFIDAELTDKGKEFTESHYDYYCNEILKIADENIFKTSAEQYPYDQIKSRLDDLLMGKVMLPKPKKPFWKIW